MNELAGSGPWKDGVKTPRGRAAGSCGGKEMLPDNVIIIIPLYYTGYTDMSVFASAQKWLLYKQRMIYY
jgi:hypothetical protein